MKKITPFKNVADAMEALDNGGRFFNFLSKADDGTIDQSELGKVVGVFSDKQQMIIFLELSMIDLSVAEKNTIISKLETKLQKSYHKYKPQKLQISEVSKMGEISSSAMVSGIPHKIDSKTQFNGFIMFPIIVNNVTTFTMIPLIDHYEVYEIQDVNSDEKIMVAHHQGAEPLPNKKVTLGGVFKELKEEDASATNKFLEIVYCIEN